MQRWWWRWCKILPSEGNSANKFQFDRVWQKTKSDERCFMDNARHSDWRGEHYRFTHSNGIHHSRVKQCTPGHNWQTRIEFLAYYISQYQGRNGIGIASICGRHFAIRFGTCFPPLKWIISNGLQSEWDQWYPGWLLRTRVLFLSLLSYSSPLHSACTLPPPSLPASALLYTHSRHRVIAATWFHVFPYIEFCFGNLRPVFFCFCDAVDAPKP